MFADRRPHARRLPQLQLSQLKRVCSSEAAARERRVPKGAKLMVGLSSAMMDSRRVPDPYAFDPRRLPHEYIHFGYGLHQCFGMHINRAVLPAMLKPLLKRENLRRARGRAGRLKKQGAFATELHLLYD